MNWAVVCGFVNRHYPPAPPPPPPCSKVDLLGTDFKKLAVRLYLDPFNEWTEEEKVELYTKHGNRLKTLLCSSLILILKTESHLSVLLTVPSMCLVINLFTKRLFLEFSKLFVSFPIMVQQVRFLLVGLKRSIHHHPMTGNNEHRLCFIDVMKSDQGVDVIKHWFNDSELSLWQNAFLSAIETQKSFSMMYVLSKETHTLLTLESPDFLLRLTCEFIPIDIDWWMTVMYDQARTEICEVCHRICRPMDRIVCPGCRRSAFCTKDFQQDDARKYRHDFICLRREDVSYTAIIHRMVKLNECKASLTNIYMTQLEIERIYKRLPVANNEQRQDHDVPCDNECQTKLATTLSSS